MLSLTLDVLQRAEGLLDDNSNWFETIGNWYKNAGLSRKIVAELLRREAGADQITVEVNGQSLERASQVTDPGSRRITWLLPSDLLKKGPNQIVVRVDRRASSCLPLRAVSCEQDYHLPWQTVYLSAARPTPAPSLAIEGKGNAYHGGEEWSVEQGGFVQLKLTLAHAGPVNFTLQLGQGRAGIWMDLARELTDEIKDEIKEALKEKLWQLAKDVERSWRMADAQAWKVQEDYNALAAYAKLHRVHIEPAFAGPPDQTLEEVIAKTARPDVLVREAKASQPTSLIVLEAAEMIPTVQLAPPDELIPTASLANPRPRKTPRSPRQAQRSFGGSCLTTLAKLLFVVVAIVGIGGLIAWRSATVQGWIQQLGNLVPNPGNDKPRPDDGEQKLDALVQAKGGKKGEVQVTLEWFNKNDLDLHVVPPAGEQEEIFWGHRTSRCGGHLDVDMNVVHDLAQAHAAENVAWANGPAPRGQYKVYVVHFNNLGHVDCRDPTEYHVRVIVRGREEHFRGHLTFDPLKPKVHVHTFVVD
jgi:hypothetical protein